MIGNQKNINLFIIVLLITLISLYVIKNYTNIIEKYTSLCEVQSTGSNYIDCYYKRLRQGVYKDNFDKGNYSSEVYLIRDPSDYNDQNISHRVGLLLFYLKYRRQFPKIGCGTGWINKIDENVNDVISDWAYYIHKTMTDDDTKSQVLSGLAESKTYNMRALKYYNYNETRILKSTLVPADPTATTYLEIKNKHSSQLEKNMFEIMMITFLAHYITNNTRTGYNAFYRWGVPVYKDKAIVNGKAEKIDISPNTQAFNYYYNIKLGNEYLAFDDTDNKFKFKPDDEINLTNPKYLFRIVYNSDCGDYLKIKNASSGGFLKIGQYDSPTVRNADLINSSSEQDGTTFFFDYQHLDNDLTIDINKIFIPLSIGQTDNIRARTGDYVTIIAKSNRNNAFISYLIKASDGTAKIHRILNPNDIEISQMLTNPITLPGINCTTHNAFKFIRQGLFNPAKYVYKEKLITDTNTNAPQGSKMDVGGIYEFLNSGNGNGGNISPNEITSMSAVTTNQKVFPVYNDGDNADNCIYTGDQQSIRGIQNVCALDPRCYGEFNSPNDNFKRIYVGPRCNLPIKKVERTGNSYDKKERRGSIICNESGPTDMDSTNGTKLAGDNKVKAFVCYQPKYSDNVQPSTSLVHPRSANYPECRENRDYGMLDAPTLQMYVANNRCDADYKYFNDPLKSVSGERVCRPGTLCEFSNSIAPGEKNYTFLNDTDLTIIKNQNISLKNKLGQLENKLSTFKQNLSKKENDSKEKESVLLDELNNSVLDKLNLNLKKLNQVAFNELQK